MDLVDVLLAAKAACAGCQMMMIAKSRKELRKFSCKNIEKDRVCYPYKTINKLELFLYIISTGISVDLSGGTFIDYVLCVE